MTEIKTKREAVRESIRSLLRTVNSLKPLLIGIDELPALGFTPVRVELDTDGQSLKFDPCFFSPLPMSVIDEHPILPEYDQDPDIDNYNFDDPLYLQDLEDELEEEYGTEVPQQVVRERYRKDIWEGKTHHGTEAANMAIYIDHFYSSLRLGGSTSTRLWNFTPIRWLCFPSFKSSEDIGMFAKLAGPGYNYWTLENAAEDQSGEVPHSISSFRQEYAANDESITTGELQGIMRMMHIHYGYRKLEHHLTLPLLAISYTGPRHGRIIQAHHDGEKMILQYSPLMSFVDGKTAPVSLFVRYTASLPLYPTATKTLCIR